MTISKYHEQYIRQSDVDIKKKIDAKRQELESVFDKVSLSSKKELLRIAVLGCGDRRFVSLHKVMFEEILGRLVDITTFDITVDHLQGEEGVVRHDCTMPLPGLPYDIIYSHILIKFIETEKQFDVLKNSYDALGPDGVAVHVFNSEEIESNEVKLADGSWAVPLDRWKKQLGELNVSFKEIDLKYGPALVLIK